MKKPKLFYVVLLARVVAIYALFRIGRWYVFRAQPQWFVVFVALLSRMPESSVHEGFSRWAQSAREELRLRHRQRKLAR